MLKYIKNLLKKAYKEIKLYKEYERRSSVLNKKI